MNQDDYKEKIKELDKERDLKIIELRKEFAKANHKAYIGDIITDGNFPILVDRIWAGTPYFTNEICVLYTGKQLTKNLKLRKDGERRTIEQRLGFKVLKTSQQAKSGD